MVDPAGFISGNMAGKLENGCLQRHDKYGSNSKWCAKQNSDDECRSFQTEFDDTNGGFGKPFSDYDHEGETRRPVFHWIPEGWTECDKSLIRNTTHIEFTHESVEKSSLIIRIHRVTPTSGHTTSFNTENAEVSTIEINGNEALLVVGDDYVLLKWFIENYSCSISMSHIVAVEDVIKFAENMELK